MTIRLKHLTKPLIAATVFAASSAACFATTSAQHQQMSFFITSAGSGDGANLGSLGADKTCCRPSRRQPASVTEHGTHT